jgi:hypothetical protein
LSPIAPRCPNVSCVHHHDPVPGFCRKIGFYWTKSRGRVQRLRCGACRRTFSEQTFRHDYRDKKPQSNAMLLRLVTSGVGLRQCGRLLDLDIHTVQDKLQKIARTCRGLLDNLTPVLPGRRVFLMDEEETYEAASIRPLTMPVVIEKESWFVVATAVGPIRRLAKRGTARRAAQDRDEQRRGRRPDESRRCVTAVLEQLAAKLPQGDLVLRTDEKASYRTIAKRLFGGRVQHETTSSRQVRDKRNPLFPINTTLAMTRDNCGRLRRRSWLVTKKAERLQCQMDVFAVYRNFMRRRFNRDASQETPAWHLGLVSRALTAEEVVSWRQDWGERSIHPMSCDGRQTVRDPRFLRATAA